MSDLVTKAEPRSVCAHCNQPLFGLVKFCPFCGVVQGVPNEARHSTPPAAAQVKQEQPEEVLKKPGPLKQTVEQAVGVGVRLHQPAPVASTPVVPGTTHVEAAKPEPMAKPADPIAPPLADKPKIAATTADGPPKAPPRPPPPTQPWWKKGILPLIFLGAVYGGWQWVGSPKEPDACQQALEGADTSMRNKQYAQAKTLALGAVARCNNDSQGRAKTLLQAAEVALVEEAKCNQALQLASSQIADGNLRQADRTLSTQSVSCAARAEVVVGKAEIETSRTFAAGKVNEAQTQLVSGQFETARNLIDEAERRDRDNSLIPQTRARIAQAEREATRAVAEAAAQAAAVQVPLSPPASQVPELGPFRPPSLARPAANEENKQMECAILVRAGERALTSNSYDVAMQSAREAQTAVANCPGAQELFHRARLAKDEARRGAVIN